MVHFEPLTSIHAAELSELAQRIFIDTFLPSNAAEPVHAYANEYLSAEAFQKTLVDPAFTSLGVYVAGQLVGYIQLVRNREESYEGTDLELKRFYLEFSQHGKGIARDMMEKVYDIAKGLGYKKFWLGVWEKNDRALRFYTKNGFRRVSSHVFNMGGEIQTDDIYIKEL